MKKVTAVCIDGPLEGEVVSTETATNYIHVIRGGKTHTYYLMFDAPWLLKYSQNAG